MASLSVSAIADTAAVAALLIPMMRNAGYSVPRASGLIASGGIIAPIIPPSIGFVMVGVVGNISITKLFIAGIAPGLMMALALVATWTFQARRSEEHTSELQSLMRISYAVFCLKKKTISHKNKQHKNYQYTKNHKTKSTN